MKIEISRGDVWNVVGLCPCAIVSPDSMNHSLETVIVVPLSTKKKDWPTRVETHFDGKEGQALCEQIRTVSKKRLKNKIDKLKVTEVVQIKLVLKQMLFE